MTDEVSTRYEGEDIEEEDEGHCFDCGLLHDECECQIGADCGRWRNGRLDKHCSKAGSEECDFECPYSR